LKRKWLWGKTSVMGKKSWELSPYRRATDAVGGGESDGLPVDKKKIIKREEKKDIRPEQPRRVEAWAGPAKKTSVEPKRPYWTRKKEEFGPGARGEGGWHPDKVGKTTQPGPAKRKGL